MGSNERERERENPKRDDGKWIVQSGTDIRRLSRVSVSFVSSVLFMVGAWDFFFFVVSEWLVAAFKLLHSNCSRL